MLAVILLQWCQGNEFKCVWVCPIGACYLHPPESSFLSPPLPLFTCAELLWALCSTGSGTFCLFSSSRGGIEPPSLSHYLFCCVDAMHSYGSLLIAELWSFHMHWYNKIRCGHRLYFAEKAIVWCHSSKFTAIVYYSKLIHIAPQCECMVTVNCHCLHSLSSSSLSVCLYFYLRCDYQPSCEQFH